MNSKARIGVILLLLTCAFTGHTQVRISEFMASNSQTLMDEEGFYSDWIEIQNTSDEAVNLQNWALSDSAGTPTKWLFPSTNISARGYMVVFASGKNRTLPGKPLHTNFKLSSIGEKLFLISPGGQVASSINYPAQFPDVSYGLAMISTTSVLVSSNDAVRFLIPSNSDADLTWIKSDYSDSEWNSGVNGFGYDLHLSDPQEELYSQTCLQTKPVAYWRLNETAGTAATNIGTSAPDNVAGYMGNITLGQAGPQPPSQSSFESNNIAPMFNGSDSYVSGPYELLNDLSAFTMAGWIKPTATPGSRIGLFGQNDLVEFGFNSGNTLNLWTPSGSVTYNYPHPLNEWHHVAVVGGDGKLKIYVDGILCSSSSVNVDTFGESEYFFNIGGGGIWDGSGNFFTGQIDEVAVWFRALSDDELTMLTQTNSASADLSPYINTDVKDKLYNTSSTMYLRMPFSLTSTTALDGLKLRVRYDDGFAAWLNGHLIASANAPTNLNWQSTATARHLNSNAINWQEFNVNDAIQFLQPGNNILAVQGLNITASNTDFLIQAELMGETLFNEAQWRYFSNSTPGKINSASLDKGPIFSRAGHWPQQPSATDSLVVTTALAQAFAPLSEVTLNYRVMFKSELAIPMNDSGTNGDAVAGDGIWTATIPANIATAGQMIRYYITATDTSSNSSRWPIFPAAATSQKYLGTIVADPTVKSLLPVVWLYVENLSNAGTQNGTQASFFYQGEFYDNLNMTIHGQSSYWWNKHSYNIDLPKDHGLLYNDTRLKKIRLLSNYGDKMRMHTTLTYEVVRMGGADGHFSFPVRVQCNGSFFSVVDVVEAGNDQFVERLGRDPNGALYKVYDELSSAYGSEKKTREWEGNDDLASLIANLNEIKAIAKRAQYAYDNLDLPQTTGYFATFAISSSQDHGHKNFYMYHDNDGTGEWAILPWDVDLTWGRNWLDSQGYFTDTLFTNNVLNFYNYSQQSKSPNRLYDLFFGYTDFQQMYLRRLRTLMDTILMPPGTLSDQLVLEPLIRHYEDIMSPTNINPSDATLDMNAWGPNWGATTNRALRVEAERTISTYLVGRRNFLYNNSSATLNGTPIPSAQPTNTVIQIASWDYNPASSNLDEQYVELKNTNAYAVDVSNWKLTGAISITLRPGTVIPIGKSLYVTPSVNAFRNRNTSPHSGQGIYVQGPYSGYLSSNGNSPLTLHRDDGSIAFANTFATNVSSTIQFFSTNLVVLRLGDGIETLGNRGNSIFLDQFTTNGLPCGTLTIPNDGSNAMLISGTASSEGALSRSADGRFLSFACYNIPLTNTASLSSSLANATAANVPRAAGLLDPLGTVSLIAVTTNQFNKNNIRSAAADGLGRIWMAGATSGILAFEGEESPLIETNIINTTTLQAIEANLYFSTTKSSPGIYSIPVTADSSPLVPNLVLYAGDTSSPFAFAFNPNFTTAYVADDTLDGHGGIQRWTFTNANWQLDYVFNCLTNVGARGLAVDFSSDKPLLYFTTAESATNRLGAIVDNGAESPMILLATAGPNQIFRGVTFGPNNTLSPRLSRIQGGTSIITFTWTTFIGQSYTLEYTDNLSAPQWITFANFLATNCVTSIDVPVQGEGSRFFRLKLNRN